MSSNATSQTSQTDWKRIHSMKDEDIDLSEIPEVTEEQFQRAVLRVGGKVVPEGKSLVSILLDTDVLDDFKTRGGKGGFQALINKALRASMAKA